MPFYTYICACGKKYEEYRKIDNRHNPFLCTCGEQAEFRIMPTAVIADIQPYMSVAVDKESGERVMINSRRQHEEFLRRNDYVEIGNEKLPSATRPTVEVEEPEAPTLTMEEAQAQGFIVEDL